MLVLTFAMLALHLFTATALRRHWVSAMALLRIEAAYYVVLVSYLVFHRTRFLLIAGLSLAAIHLALWLHGELRRSKSAGLTRATLVAVQLFDSLEAVALGAIVYVLIGKR